jgi:hypothetical protein
MSETILPEQKIEENKKRQEEEEIIRANEFNEVGDFKGKEFKPNILERSGITVQQGVLGFQDAIVLQTNKHNNTDVYSNNDKAFIDGRTNKYQDFNSNEEYGNRAIRIQPNFNARDKNNDSSGLIGREGKRQYYTGVDKDTGIISVYRASSTGNDDPMGYYDKEGKFVPLEGRNGETFATNKEIAYFSGDKTYLNDKGEEVELTTNDGVPIEGGDKFVKNEALKQAHDQYLRDVANGKAPPPDRSPYEANTGIPYEDSDEFKLEEEISSNVDDVKQGGGKDMNARKKYRTDLEFPTGITDLFQDKLKITVMKFEPAEIGGGSGINVNEAGDILTNNLGANIAIALQTKQSGTRIKYDSEDRKAGVSPFVGKRKAFSEREILGSVVLPIPDGVTDFNAVQFADGAMNPLQMASANLALKTLLEGQGGPAAADIFKTAAESGDLPLAISSALTASAVGTDADRLLARTRGKIFNNNLQLLFSGPTLRPFNFQYDISPRDKTEADNVKRIIRMFKQSMAVQRDNVGIFLGSPNTYRLEFLDPILDTHQYLPIIKECALLNFSVNYMPTNSYMTYDDSSMVVYRLNFSFKELDPIYNDDYGNLDGTDSSDTEIGF